VTRHTYMSLVLTMKTDLTSLLILAMIAKAGADSFYALRQATSLVPGVLLLRLKQLSGGGAVSTAATGERGKKRLKLTATGRTLLEHDWPSAVEASLQEQFEVVLRAFWVARLMGGQDRALQLLRSACDQRNKPAKHIRDVSLPRGRVSGGFLYLQSKVEPARLKSEAFLFESLAEMLMEQRPEW
jgi:hypothetical protein